MKSMTGFGQGRFEFHNISLSISFKALNHRFLDIYFKGTGMTPALEKIIRDIVKKHVYRGKIDVSFDLFLTDQTKYKMHFNDELLSKILDELLFFKKRYKEKISFSIDSLLKIPMIFHLEYLTEEFNERDAQQINSAIEQVFQRFLKHRHEEGQAILKNLQVSIKIIEYNLGKIEKKTLQLEKDSFQKYKEKITKYIKDFDVDERRILQEAAILAEKSSISEEIHRLQIHCQRLKELLKNPDIEVKGREADFLSQEMYRETHTIAAKIDALDFQDFVLNIRREIEKIKQQVQNVE